MRFLRNFFFLIFLLGPGFGASNKKEIKKLKKKVQLISDEFELKFQLMEHIIGNIHETVLHIYTHRAFVLEKTTYGCASTYMTVTVSSKKMLSI